MPERDWKVIEGDCVEQMRAMAEASVDAIVCDPPYGLEFMGKDWDRLDLRQPFRGEVATPDNPYGRTPVRYPHGDGLRASRAQQMWHEAWAREALRVLKPGGHLLAFGGTRTYHRLACAIEDAGFKIRDTIAWMYGSGFPKSLDVSKAIDAAAGAVREPGEPGPYAARRPREDVQALNAYHDGVGDAASALVTKPATPDAERWQGWGTALKPAHEPIVVARKPLSGTVAATVLRHGTGALNVDGCRIDTGGETITAGLLDPANRRGVVGQAWQAASDAERNQQAQRESLARANALGRWPANVILDPEAAAMLDAQTGERPPGGNINGAGPRNNAVYGRDDNDRGDWTAYGDSGGASRFFYVAKASSAERNAGLDGFEVAAKRTVMNDGLQGPRPHTAPDYEWQPKDVRNVHPTVKPIDLMRWLVRLVTPPAGLVLDPFAGSGTTGCAAVLEGFRFVGIEREPEYAVIARARIAWWAEHPDGMELVERLEAEKQRKAVAEAGQLDLFA